MNLDRIGKYRIVGRIGQGAMGEVFKAHDPLLNRYVALKTIAPALAADEQFRERFRREAQSAARLNHPNIVTVYDFGEESGVTYMAMELLEGLELREGIRRRALGHIGRRLDILEQLCDGVAFAHGRGVVHRDLKPGNIHVQPSGLVKILDFGLARLGASEMTRTGTVMGTPHYMSPEQVRGEKADARSDVFSLGAIFYEVLCGHRAFDAPQVAQVLQAITDRDPEPLRKRADVPPGLAAVVERALAKPPSRRFADAGEMGRELERAREALAGETLAAPSAADEAEGTTLSGAGATIVLGGPGAPATVAGANALDLTATPRTRHEAPGTVRPDPTMGPGPETEVPARSRGLLVGAVLLVAASLVGSFLWLRSRPGDDGSAPTGGETVGILTETLLMSKVELARDELDRREYAAAAERAREALAIDPGYAEARQILDQAEDARRRLDAAADEATSAFEQGDSARASEALARVLALDPSHPVAEKLSSELNRFFRGQAEDARGQVRNARLAADTAKAADEADYRRARGLEADADRLFGRELYAEAAAKYLESRNAFGLARNAAEVRRAAATPPPPRPAPTPVPAPTVVARATPDATPTPAVPSPNPTAAVATPLPSPSAPLPAVPTPDPRVAAIEGVLAGYERAYETLDVSALRSVMEVTPDLEKGLREAFKAFKSYDVEMSAPAVEFEADGRARVRVSRVDTVNGRRQDPKTQTFVIARQGGGWRIVSYAFGR